MASSPAVVLAADDNDDGTRAADDDDVVLVAEEAVVDGVHCRSRTRASAARMVESKSRIFPRGEESWGYRSMRPLHCVGEGRDDVCASPSEVVLFSRLSA